MRLLIVSLLVLLGAVSLALFARDDTGHIVIAYGNWTLETSLALFVLALLAIFLTLYYTLRLWSGIRALPRRLRRWRRQRRHLKTRMAYMRGMHALAEGQWETAEKWLLKQVRYSDTPALNYLAAAQAAEALGSHVRRDGYLRAAHEHEPKAGVAVGLAQAGFLLAHQRADDALNILARLHGEQPKHTAVLKKLMETHAARQDWQRVLELVPEVERRGAISVSRAEELQGRAYRALFGRAAEQKDADQLRQLWERVPRYVKRNEDVLFDYARALSAVDDNAGEQLEPLLADALRRRWNDNLVYVYGLIPQRNLSAQLAQAERWLKHHAENPVLLLTLGRVCVRSQLWGKARSYLEASLGRDPQPETYRELGALLEKINNRDAALECYRNALVRMPGKSFARPAPSPQDPVMPPDELPLLPRQTS